MSDIGQYRMTSTAELLRNMVYRRLLAGRIVTNAGDSLYFVGATWLVYELTGSTAYTGLAGFLVFLPRGFRFLTGPFVDRWPLRPLASLRGGPVLYGPCPRPSAQDWHSAQSVPPGSSGHRSVDSGQSDTAWGACSG